jgi:hypothetical protein
MSNGYHKSSNTRTYIQNIVGSESNFEDPAQNHGKRSTQLVNAQIKSTDQEGKVPMNQGTRSGSRAGEERARVRD